MEVTFTRFVHALRSAELPVSPAETLDGFEVIQQIGISDPTLLELEREFGPVHTPPPTVVVRQHSLLEYNTLCPNVVEVAHV